MTDRLGRYREMRDFGVTPEPQGKKISSRKGELRYYIQRHDATRLHYDLRLELEGVIPEKQYGAGDVLLWDKGVWMPEDKDPVASGATKARAPASTSSRSGPKA